ncbi:MAG: hypothetical protein Q7S47_01280 [bacterium]|nr:hypothetical protein [bacterium]
MKLGIAAGLIVALMAGCTSITVPTLPTVTRMEEVKLKPEEQQQAKGSAGSLREAVVLASYHVGPWGPGTPVVTRIRTPKDIAVGLEIAAKTGSWLVNFGDNDKIGFTVESGYDQGMKPGAYKTLKRYIKAGTYGITIEDMTGMQVSTVMFVNVQDGNPPIEDPPAPAARHQDPSAYINPAPNGLWLGNLNRTPYTRQCVSFGGILSNVWENIYLKIPRMRSWQP